MLEHYETQIAEGKRQEEERRKQTEEETRLKKQEEEKKGKELATTKAGANASTTAPKLSAYDELREQIAAAAQNIEKSKLANKKKNPPGKKGKGGKEPKAKKNKILASFSLAPEPEETGKEEDEEEEDEEEEDEEDEEEEQPTAPKDLKKPAAAPKDLKKRPASCAASIPMCKGYPAMPDIRGTKFETFFWKKGKVLGDLKKGIFRVYRDKADYKHDLKVKWSQFAKKSDAWIWAMKLIEGEVDSASPS